MSKKSSYIDHAGHLVEIRSDGSRRVSLGFDGDAGCTEQSHKEFADISYILNQHIKQTGSLPQLMPGQFQDLTSLPDYQTCLNTVLQIDDLFDSLPVKVKEEFGQDPVRFTRSLSDPMQRDRLIELGVLDASVKAKDDISSQDPVKTQKTAEGG